jgi:integrase
MKLTTQSIASLQLGDKTDQIFFDDELKRFGLRLRKTSDGKVSRNWIVQYRQDGRQRRQKLGSADVVSAEQARKHAIKILAHVHLGEDPQGEKADRRSKDEDTFKAVAQEYLTDRKDGVRPRTHEQNVRYLTGAYFRPLHPVAMDRIKLRDISQCLRAVKRDSGTVSANRAGSAVAALCRWAMRNGYLETNPAVDLEKYEETARSRVLSDAELAAIWNTAAGGDDNFGKIVRLLILTGCRRREIGDMAHSEYDSDSGVWTIPAARTKNKHEHELPLPPQAWEIIDAVPRGSRDDLFGVRGGGGFDNWHDAKQAFDAKLGDDVKPWTLHDLRRTMATKLSESPPKGLGVQPHIVEAILNHQGGHKAGVAGIYNRATYVPEVRAALARWADHVTALAAGSERKILPIRRLPLDATTRL